MTMVSTKSTRRFVDAIDLSVCDWLELHYTFEELMALAVMACFSGRDEWFSYERLSEVLRTVGVRLTNAMMLKFEQERVIRHVTAAGNVQMWNRQYRFWQQVRWAFRSTAATEYRKVHLWLRHEAEKAAVQKFGGATDFETKKLLVIYNTRLGYLEGPAEMMIELARWSRGDEAKELLMLALRESS